MCRVHDATSFAILPSFVMGFRTTGRFNRVYGGLGRSPELGWECSASFEHVCCALIGGRMGCA